MIKGDIVFIYKEKEIFHGKMVHKLKDKLVFQVKDIDKIENEEILDYQIVNPVNGVTMVQSKTYVLDPDRNYIVIQVPKRQDVQRRKDIRVDAKILCESEWIYSIEKGRKEHKQIKFIARNISEGGMNIITDKPIPIGTRMAFPMNLPNLPPITVEMKILRVQRTSGHYNYGCMFQELLPEAKAVIGKYVLTIMRENFVQHLEEEEMKRGKLQDKLSQYKSRTVATWNNNL